MTENKKATIKRIEHEEDRTLLYIDNNKTMPTYVIAPKTFNGKIGDTITYEPYGVNFGWLMEGGNHENQN